MTGEAVELIECVSDIESIQLEGALKLLFSLHAIGPLCLKPLHFLYSNVGIGIGCGCGSG
jgi:hypothetical protein